MGQGRYQSQIIIGRRKIRLDSQALHWADASTQPAADEHQPAALAELAQARLRVQAAIQQLPPEQQQVLALAYFGGYTHQQIAETLGQPLGTVKTRIRSAIKKLRHLLHDEINPSD